MFTYFSRDVLVLQFWYEEKAGKSTKTITTELKF